MTSSVLTTYETFRDYVKQERRAEEVNNEELSSNK